MWLRSNHSFPLYLTYDTYSDIETIRTSLVTGGRVLPHALHNGCANQERPPNKEGPGKAEPLSISKSLI